MLDMDRERGACLVRFGFVQFLIWDSTKICYVQCCIEGDDRD